jgi:restriction system protein
VEWFWILLGAILVVRVAVRIARQRRLARSGIYDIDRMDGRTFEHYLRTMFARHGYKVEVTKYRGDFGADLILRRDGSKVAVQAKRASKNVGVRAIQEAVAAKG